MLSTWNLLCDYSSTQELLLNVLNPTQYTQDGAHSQRDGLGSRFGTAHARSCVSGRSLVNIFPT